MNFTTVDKMQPPPHRKCLVLRDGVFVTATPCYGLHVPWWVTADIYGKEYSPVNMLPSDEWTPLWEERKE